MILKGCKDDREALCLYAEFQRCKYFQHITGRKGNLISFYGLQIRFKVGIAIKYFIDSTDLIVYIIF